MAFNPLALLLGQQSSAAIPETVGNDLTVVGTPPASADPNVDVNGPEAPFMGNKSYLEEAAASMGEAPERSGMFGTRGTLRDILGVVGDAFLTQAGRNTVYAPQRDRERMADAMTGFTNSEESAMAAIERLSQAGYTDQARQLYENIQTNKLRQAQQASLEANRQSLIAGRDDTRLANFRKYASQALASAGDNPKSQQYAIQLLTQQAERLGIPLEDIGITEGMSPEQMRVLADAGMPVQNIRNLPIAQQRADTGRYNAETARRSQQDRASRPNRSVTKAEQFEEARNTPPDQRTPEQNDLIDDYVGRNKGSGRSGRSRGNPPSLERQGRFKPIG